MSKILKTAILTFVISAGVFAGPTAVENIGQLINEVNTVEADQCLPGSMKEVSTVNTSWNNQIDAAYRLIDE